MLDIDEAEQIAAEWISKEVSDGTLIGDPDEYEGKWIWSPGQGGTGEENILTDTPPVVVDQNTGEVGWGEVQEIEHDTVPTAQPFADTPTTEEETTNG